MADFYVDSSGFKRYKNSKRLMYNPELFPNHKTKWSKEDEIDLVGCLLYTSPSPRDA